MSKEVLNIYKLAKTFEIKTAQQSGDAAQAMFLGYNLETEFKNKAIGNLSQVGNKVVGSGKITEIIANYFNTKQAHFSVSVDAIVDAIAKPKVAKFTATASDPTMVSVIMAALEGVYLEVYHKHPPQVVEQAVKEDATLANTKGTYHLYDGEV